MTRIAAIALLLAPSAALADDLIAADVAPLPAELSAEALGEELLAAATMSTDAEVRAGTFVVALADAEGLVGAAASPTLGANEFPSGDTFFPSGDTFFPSGDTFFPSGDTFFPSGDTFFPSGDTFFPSGDTFVVIDNGSGMSCHVADRPTRACAALLDAMEPAAHVSAAALVEEEGDVVVLFAMVGDAEAMVAPAAVRLR